MKLNICIFFLMLVSPLLGQETDKSILKGMISANSIDLDGVYVINLRTEKSTITEKDGSFSILAIPGDALLFSSMNLKEMEIILKPEDFQQEIFLVKLESNITQLREVVVTKYDNINAVDLGISPEGMIHRTEAERKLYTAKSTSVDAISNLISGRTAMLKKEIKVEKKLSNIELIDNMFNEDYFKNTLKIPVEYIKGFQYYIVENDRFASVLKSKNKTNIEFLMIQLAEKYTKMIANEK